MFDGFFKGKSVFLTGHSGFKGAWLALWLKRLGADVTGYSLNSPTQPNLLETLPSDTFCAQIEGDIRDAPRVASALARGLPARQRGNPRERAAPAGPA